MHKEIASVDAKHRVEIASDGGGLFKFTEYSELWDEGYGNLPGSFYWTPTHVSGLYDTAKMAEADACAILPWLRSLISN